MSADRKGYCAWAASDRKCDFTRKVVDGQLQGWGPGCVKNGAICAATGGQDKVQCGACAVECALPPTGPWALAAAAVCAVALAAP
eukprot:CAMPEP_0198325126 /NCGR_PEP_ID=MMETSP1450-20131203/12938_1 /TAXON_ID=753684 ORGANISM="Madagascaria erythrocladiodes, Strain CCMP3234" /NCGR_SAMPLE_ID=MMETSP1450 /ASSEMBLY_ACC=CAM_ASM_001115 /LENGTH=84 /DNA_ID=CAMNT_0044028973 /DNA_START=1242 /DNA_END=1496 /DNA_ORIENTATION=+